MLDRLSTPSICRVSCRRAGPRIFVGKLTKDTTDGDVKEYFMRFGYVMDVYLPKAKDNKMEHRCTPHAFMTCFLCSANLACSLLLLLACFVNKYGVYSFQHCCLHVGLCTSIVHVLA